MLTTEALRDSTLRPWVNKVGEETSFEQIMGPYALRRAAGTELDSSGNSLPSVHGTTGADCSLSQKPSAIPSAI